MTESKSFQLGTVGALSLSVVLSVSILICNKALITTLGLILVLSGGLNNLESLPFLSWVPVINVGELFGHVWKMQTWADLKIVKQLIDANLYALLGKRTTTDDEKPIKKKKEKFVKVEECTTAVDTLPKPSEEGLNPKTKVEDNYVWCKICKALGHQIKFGVCFIR